MNNYYEDVYVNRLNRYGNDYQSRILGQRQKVFEQFLEKSIYRVDFEYNGEMHPASLEPYKQNETKTLQCLLTRLELKIPAGTILEIPKLQLDFEEPEYEYWMIYWLENKQTSGYNRYIVLRLSHIINWTDRDGVQRSMRGYFYGQEDNMLKDELKSRSRNHALYNEDLKLDFIIIPFNSHIRKDDYFEVVTGIDDNTLTQAFVVTGHDVISTPGVEYVSVDPQYVRDNTPAPEYTPGQDSQETYYWLNGGDTDGD